MSNANVQNRRCLPRGIVSRAGRGVVLLALAVLASCAHVAHRPPSPAPPELRIYLARHGETDWNRERRIQGQTDTELNVVGREQATRLGERLAGIQLDRVYSSPLKRCSQTAGLAGGGAPIVILAGLAERHAGAFQGVRLDGSEPEREAEYRRRFADPGDSLDDGETFEQHRRRVQLAVAEILRDFANDGGTILVVGHGYTNPLVLRELLALTAEQADAINQANDELYVIEMVAGRPPRLWKDIPNGRTGEL